MQAGRNRITDPHFPPTTGVYDNATRDNLSVYQVLLSEFSAEMTLHETSMINGFNTN